MTYRPHNWFDKFIRDKDGEVVIWQFPNIPLWSWIIFTLLAMVITHGRGHNFSTKLAQASLFTWAFMELHSGKSLFRRVLGGVVLIIIVVGFFK